MTVPNQPPDRRPNLPAAPAGGDPSKDPNMIRVFDEYGRELFITRQQWRDNVLLGNLERERDKPDQLYNIIVGALRDGFGADVVPFAEHLRQIDPNPARGAILLGIVYVEVNRLDEAQAIFEELIARDGQDSILLTNLARVHSRRGDEAGAEALLWHALELDPNQENAFGWYTGLQAERGGADAALAAYRRVAGLPGSWRARLWLAREALDGNDLAGAETIYAEAIGVAGHPVPADLLMQMSGDLGNHGHVGEILRLTGPHFDPAFHGIQAGNNLIKANLDLGRLEEARALLNRLYMQKRPDWRQTLSYWEAELAKARLVPDRSAAPQPAQLEVSIIQIEAPLWTRDGSPFAALLPARRDDAARVALFGSTVVYAQAQAQPGRQLSDTAGRLSRSVPLLLAEAIRLGTDATGLALIPWANGHGFALFGEPDDDAALCKLAAIGARPADTIAALVIETAAVEWKLTLRLVRRLDGARLAETSVSAAPDQAMGAAVDKLRVELLGWLAVHTGATLLAPPSWYAPPADLPDYSLRLEQQLAVLCQNLKPGDGAALYGEREMLDGALQLCLRQPAGAVPRMLYAQTLREMRKLRPEIVAEYREKTEKLQHEYPLDGEIEVLLDKAYNEAFPA